jgi:hypothetical protein
MRDIADGKSLLHGPGDFRQLARSESLRSR